MPMAQARALCPRRGDRRRRHGQVPPGERADPRRVRERQPAGRAAVARRGVHRRHGVGRLLGPPLAIGRLLRERVRAATGLAVSVGIGPAKMVAKIASDLAKPDGLLEVRPERREGLSRAAARRPAVGRRAGDGGGARAPRRRDDGDLAAADLGWLRRHVGNAAEALRRLAAGDDVRSVESDREARSYGEENTFARDMRDDRTIRDAIIAHGKRWRAGCATTACGRGRWC